MIGIPRRHHYVTKAYLEGFTEPGANHLFCYGRKRNAPFPNTPVNLANIRDFHSVKRADGSIDTSLETLIEREIENPGIPVLRKLASGKLNICYADRSALARLVGLQSVRVPFERNFMDSNNVQNLRSYIEEMDEATHRLGSPVNALEIAVSAKDDPLSIKEWTTFTRQGVLAALRRADEDPTKCSRETFFGLSADLQRILVKMEWTVYYAQGNARFLTSDRPVIQNSSNSQGLGRGLKDLRSEVFFPISSSALLHIKHHNWLLEEVSRKRRPQKARSTKGYEIAACKADDDFVETINRRQAKRAHLWVFSGLKVSWLIDWMKEPYNPPKRAVTVTDDTLLLSTNHQPAMMTRKREWAIQHE